MIEEWRDIACFAGYQVSSMGRVRSFRDHGSLRDTPRVLKATPTPKGYLVVCLCSAGKTSKRYVHRLVLEAFVGPCPGGMECRHVDDNDRANNRLSNLAWGTVQQNADDRARHGTVRAASGSRHGSRTKPHRVPRGEALSDITEVQAREIQVHRGPHKEMAAKHRISCAQVSRIKNRVQWAHL